MTVSLLRKGQQLNSYNFYVPRQHFAMYDHLFFLIAYDRWHISIQTNDKHHSKY